MRSRGSAIHSSKIAREACIHLFNEISNIAHPMNGFIMFPVVDCDRVRIPYQDALIITVSVKRFYPVETT